MATAIGIRVYRISVRKRGQTQPLALDAAELPKSVPQFIIEFISSKKVSTQNTSLERSWYLTEKIKEAGTTSKGYIHYGTYGFESDIVDSKTQKNNYRRQSSDVEVIPLYYEFWMPSSDVLYAYVIFQSFQGRSCVGMVMESLVETFAIKNDGFIMSYMKMMPTDEKGSLYAEASVKRLTFTKRSVAKDIADKILKHDHKAPVNLELSISAHRRQSLGAFGSLVTKMKPTAGVVIYDGVEYKEVMAEVRIGSKVRRVGMFGINSNAGVIDLTSDVKRDKTGHPTFDSLVAEVDDVIKNMFAMSKGRN